MTGVHRDTICRLLVRVGAHCDQLLESTIRDLPAGVIECDEAWTFVQKKDHQLIKSRYDADPEVGSQFIAAAMDRKTKLVIAHQVGKRVPQLALDLVGAIRQRVIGRPTIITDGWDAYFSAVARVFGRDGVHFGQLVKVVKEGKRRMVREGYTPPKVVTCKQYAIWGHPERVGISTSRIERQNWTLRTHLRRATRLSNGFSRKLANLQAAVSLHYAAYNFCKIHRALKVTPAMAAGLVTSAWGIDALIPQ
jgi:IS1 family transposase